MSDEDEKHKRRVRTPPAGVPVFDPLESSDIDITPPPHQIDQIGSALWKHVDRQTRRLWDKMLEVQADRGPGNERLDEIASIVKRLEQQSIVSSGVDGNNGRIGDLRKRVDALEPVKADIGACRAQLFGIDQKDGGRIGRLEDRVMQTEAKVSTHEKSLDRLDRMTWKIMTAAGLGGVAAASIIKVATWVMQR